MEKHIKKAQLTNTKHYFQVRNDYLAKNFDSLDHEVALQLCCLEIRRYSVTCNDRHIDWLIDYWNSKVSACNYMRPDFIKLRWILEKKIASLKWSPQIRRQILIWKIIFNS